MLPVSGLFIFFPPQLEVGAFHLWGFVWECWLLAWGFSCALTHNPWQHACILFLKSTMAVCQRYRNSKTKVSEKFMLPLVCFFSAWLQDLCEIDLWLCVLQVVSMTRRKQTTMNPTAMSLGPPKVLSAQSPSSAPCAWTEATRNLLPALCLAVKRDTR